MKVTKVREQQLMSQREFWEFFKRHKDKVALLKSLLRILTLRLHNNQRLFSSSLK